MKKQVCGMIFIVDPHPQFFFKKKFVILEFFCHKALFYSVKCYTTHMTLTHDID